MQSPPIAATKVLAPGTYRGAGSSVLRPVPEPLRHSIQRSFEALLIARIFFGQRKGLAQAWPQNVLKEGNAVRGINGDAGGPGGEARHVSGTTIRAEALALNPWAGERVLVRFEASRKCVLESSLASLIDAATDSGSCRAPGPLFPGWKGSVASCAAISDRVHLNLC